MKDFITAAAPWVIMGLTLAIFFARISKKPKKSGKNHESAGIALGMCFGAAVGTMFEGGPAICISLGILIGLCVGSAVSKKEENMQENEINEENIDMQ